MQVLCTEYLNNACTFTKDTKISTLLQYSSILIYLALSMRQVFLNQIEYINTPTHFRKHCIHLLYRVQTESSQNKLVSFDIHTPCVKCQEDICHRGCMVFNWNNPLQLGYLTSQLHSSISQCSFPPFLYVPCFNPNKLYYKPYFYKILLKSAPIQGEMRQDTRKSSYRPSYCTESLQFCCLSSVACIYGTCSWGARGPRIKTSQHDFP